MTVDRGRTDFSRGNGQNTQLPPIAGGLALLGGIGLVVTSKS
ncbi:MAG: LPXTG cell wall anchor domain-containing protein [Bryobacteraceae bacterium]